ncbi:MAG: phosphotransferase [Patescibacteria group bacterium]
MFIKLKKKISKKKIKKFLDKDWVINLFNRKIKKYFPGAKIDDLEIEILRNFLGKFKNLTIRYKLFLNFGRYKRKENVLAKINALTTVPKRWFLVAKLLKKNCFKEIPVILDYLPSFNVVFYKEIKGKSLQDILQEKRISKILKIIPQIGLLLKKFHSLKIKDFPIIKNKKEEEKEHRHWFFLIRKCLPSFEKRMKKIYYSLKKFRERNKNFFLKENDYILTHGDFHFGNLILSGKKIKILDFSESDLYDPLNDVASFLAQTESMLRYYLPKKFLLYQKNIENIFLKNYFKKKIGKSEWIRIKFFKIRNFLQMAGILSFVIWPPKDKILAVKKSLDLAEKELINLKL